MSPREPGSALLQTGGTPLSLNDYIAETVKDQITGTIRNHDVREMHSPIKGFLQAWAWLQLIFGMAIGLFVLTGAGLFWKASRFWSGVAQENSQS
jgi:hypothetical protein